MSSFMHSESRYSIYVSHAGALFFYQRKDPGRPRFGGRADLYAISKRKLLALSAIEARTSDLYWSPYLIQMSRKYIRNYDVDLLKMSSKHVEDFNKRIRILCIKLEIN